VFAAIDVSTREILAIHVAEHKEFYDVAMFLRKVLKVCENKPFVLVDRGPWYPYVLERFGFVFAHMTRGLRNYIERWFLTLKERTKRFYNKFTGRRTLEAEKFLELFIFWYNCLREHMTLRRTPTSIKEVMA